MNLSKNRIATLLIIIGAALAIFCSCKGRGTAGKDQNEGVSADWNALADSSTNSLIDLFWNEGLNYFNSNSAGDDSFEYWPQAHALDVLTDAYARTGSDRYKTLIGKWFNGVKKGNGDKWENDFYDDMEWIALALEKAYRSTSDKGYLTTAEEIYGMIAKGWNDYAGGGVAWRQSEPYSKNACSNGPASILASRLYQDTGDSKMKTLAEDIYSWEKDNLLKDNLILDHIDGRDGTVKDWKFTYNQGTFVGAAVELYKITGEKQYLTDAASVADATIASLSEGGILKLEGSSDSSQNNDGHLFKGIFIRYLCQLSLADGLDSDSREKYESFVLSNAKCLWDKGSVRPPVRFGPDWETPPGEISDLKSTVSGCTLIEGAALLTSSKK